MSGINKVIITGNLTVDPELRQTTANVPVCDMRIAVSTGVKDSKVSYVDVVAWEKQAVSCGEHLKKGAWIIVEGSLKQSEWKTKTGENRSRISITAHRVVFLNEPIHTINKEE